MTRPLRAVGSAPRDERALRIVVDENIPGIERTFALHGDIRRVPGRDITAAVVADATALIVRSVTAVGPALLRDSRVRFVGTTTIGTDHLNVEWLDRRNIRWASAPGCNADAAAQYTLAMILLAGRRLGFALGERKIGLVGHGNVGSRLRRLLETCGAPSPVACDPPLSASGHEAYCDLHEIAQCNLVSLHVPLTRDGPWPTRNMLDSAFFARLPADTLLVNTSRGAVIETGALSEWLRKKRGFAALDVWPGEPDLPADLVDAATVATPHVAGYSLDGKLLGALQIYAAFRNWLGLPGHVPDLVAALPVETLTNGAATSVSEAVLTACPVGRDDAMLRTLATSRPGALGSGFDALRRDYPPRRDFSGWRLPAEVSDPVRRVLTGLGFR